MATMDLAVRLPRLHAKQLAFRNSPAKRKVIVAGRRGGKTTGVATIAVEGLLSGRRVLEAAPTADQTTAFWAACKKSLAEPLAAGLIYKNETERILELSATGARIRCKTAWDADTLRGDYADLLILDEYSLMKPSTWDEVGAPMLLDNDGDAVFIFTPQRKNHAHALYQRAKADDRGRWGHWHFTSFDNPHLSQEALAEITADLTEDSYRQEIMAEFLDNEGVVFRNIGACLGAPKGATPLDHNGHRLVIGSDWGQVVDYTVHSVVCADCRVEVDLYRRKGLDYVDQEERLDALRKHWRVGYMMPERNSIGIPIIERLLRRGMPIGLGHDELPGFNTTPLTKAPLIEGLALALERAEFQWLNDPIATGELEAYESKVSTITGKKQYSAPEGVHDDTVMARALARHAARSFVPLPAAQPQQRSRWNEQAAPDDWREDGQREQPARSRWKV